MKKEEVEKYKDVRVKITLKGSNDRYQGTILEINDDSFIILDKFNEKVTVDYEICGLIVPLKEEQR